MKKEPILITGATGFVGANLVEYFVKQNQPVHIIVRKETNFWRLKKNLSKINIHKVDLLNKKKLNLTVGKIRPKKIYHLAAYGSYPFEKDLQQIIETNILGTMNLLQCLQNIDFDCFINTGTSSEYGFKSKPMRESDMLEPTSFYAASKGATSLLAGVFSKQFQKPLITVRLFSVYGPYEEKTRFIPAIIKQCLSNQPIMLTSGLVRRDFIYVDDVISAMIAISKKATKWAGNIYNLGHGTQYSNEEVVSTLFNVLKRKVPVLIGKYQNRPWDSSNWVADISKITADCGWKPKYSLKQGLTKSVNWYKQNFAFP